MRGLAVSLGFCAGLAVCSAQADTFVVQTQGFALWTDSSGWGLQPPCYPNNPNCVFPGMIEDRWHVLLPAGTNVGLDTDVHLTELVVRGGGLVVQAPAPSHDVTVDEGITWAGGSLSGLGTIRSLSSLTIEGPVAMGNRETLINDILANASLTGSLALNTGIIIINSQGATFDLRGDGDIEPINIPPSVFTNDGLLQKSAGGLFDLGLTLSSSATGQVHVQSGTLRISADGTGSGPFTTDTGATLEFGASSSYQLDANATVGGLGTVLLRGRLDSSANWNVDGITNVSAGTVNFLVPATTRRAVHAGGRINGDLLIHEFFTWQDGVAGNGTTVLEGDAEISGSGQTGHILDNRVLNLAAGHVVNLLAQMIGMDATVNSPAGATFNMGAPLLRFASPATFNNNGSFIKTSPAASNLDWTFVNAGLFDVMEGNVQVTTSFTQTAGQTRLSGGTIGASVPLQIQGGQLTGSGQINAPVSNDATIAPGSPIGTLVFNLPLTLGDSSVLSFDIGGRTQGTEYDFISTSGQSVALNGQLQIQFLNGFEASVTDADVFILLEACPQCLSGSFANAPSGSALPTADGFGTFTVFYGPSSPFPPNQVVITNFRR